MNNPYSGICTLSAYEIPEPDEGNRYHRPICTPSIPSTPIVCLMITCSHVIVSNVTSIYTHPRVSCHNATAEPTGFTPKFAIATANGLHIMEAAGYRWNLQSKKIYLEGNENQDGRSKARKTSQYLKDTEWMTPTVVVSGGRDPSVFLNDLRANGGSRPISLKAAVSQIQKANENSIVVSEMRDDHMVSTYFHTCGWLS